MANANPLLYVTNPRALRKERVVNPGGGNKDFFAYRDREYIAHREALVEQVNAVKETILSQQSRFGPSGIARIKLADGAWAKSNRPTKKLFPPKHTPLVGSRDIGELLVRVNPTTLVDVSQKMESTEDVTRERLDRKTKKMKPHPSAERSEVGAIDSVSLWSKADRNAPSLSSVMTTCDQYGLIPIFSVDLFVPTTYWVPEEGKSKVTMRIENNEDPLVSNLLKHLRVLAANTGIVLLSETSRNSGLTTVQIGVDSEGQGLTIVTERNLHTLENLKKRMRHRFHEAQDAHQLLLDLLAEHPIVRAVRPPRIFRTDERPFMPSATSRAPAPPAKRLMDHRPISIPGPVAGQNYPRVAIVDGGVSSYLDEWVIERQEPVDEDSRSLDHGTNIAGLLVAAAQLNPQYAHRLEPDGCWIADLAMQPDPDKCQPGEYWNDGCTEFLDALEVLVRHCKREHGIRVFNFSLNGESTVSASEISEEAKRLDEIARKHDVIFVISAGNTKPEATRAEWDKRPTKALQQLATSSGDSLRTPAESLSNISVGALNPPHVITYAVPEAPACYSLRGPGVRGSVKPDLAHFGGVGAGAASSGLYSIDEDGHATSISGTSYAAPLIAKALARLDIETGGKASREVLMAMLLHGARLPAPLTKPLLAPVARNLVGFGIPEALGGLLEVAPFTFSMVISDHVRFQENAILNFKWPRSLTNAYGQCRGLVRLTLAYSPPFNYDFGVEAAQITLEIALQQALTSADTEEDDDDESIEGGKIRYSGRLKPVHSKGLKRKSREEKLILDGLKWGTVKILEKDLKDIGTSSDWRLKINYVLREQATFPKEGVPYAVVLTVTDPERVAPVYDEMRNELTTGGLRMTDIRAALRAQV